MGRAAKKEPAKIRKLKPAKKADAGLQASSRTAKPISQGKPDKTIIRRSNARAVMAGVTKKYLKTEKCKVTFRLPKEAAPEAEKVALVGDFNQWSYTELEMKKMKNGDFKLTLDLSCNREYRFKYLIDSNKWENDWCADKYDPNPFGGDDSVIII